VSTVPDAAGALDDLSPGRSHRQRSGTLVVLIAAHNEELSIVPTLRSLAAQLRKPDRIVVAADNCTDATVALAKSIKGVTVFETVDNSARKPGALNQAWHRYCNNAELVVCIDADTILEPTALGDWEAEFQANPILGGCSGKFTMLVGAGMKRSEKLLVRLQRAEFAKWTDMALRRSRRTSVLAGTACCLNNDALREVIARRPNSDPRLVEDGPWVTSSMVEDFELTYRLRELGWDTKVSATVRAYTDAMTDLRSLWAQRMKWQTGTVEDLLQFGLNRRTRFDWWQQAQGMLGVVVRTVWLVLLVAAIVTGRFQLHAWWLVPPVLFLANDVKQSLRIPKRDNGDIAVAALMFPQEMFAYMRAGWFLASWAKVLAKKIFGLKYQDVWAKQEQAEAGRRTQVSGQPAMNVASDTPLANAA
jgi:cellulose synthase/poly-beta-1,6-N-acetylglucosamine synthase-like glycosyltransferase